MSEKIKLNKSNQALLSIGSCIYEPDGTYYCYLPFWFKSTDKKNIFEILTFDNLPDKLRELIRKLRDEDKDMQLRTM